MGNSGTRTGGGWEGGGGNQCAVVSEAEATIEAQRRCVSYRNVQHRLTHAPLHDRLLQRCLRARHQARPRFGLIGRSSSIHGEGPCIQEPRHLTLIIHPGGNRGRSIVQLRTRPNCVCLCSCD